MRGCAKLAGLGSYVKIVPSEFLLMNKTIPLGLAWLASLAVVYVLATSNRSTSSRTSSPAEPIPRTQVVEVQGAKEIIFNASDVDAAADMANDTKDIRSSLRVSDVNAGRGLSPLNPATLERDLTRVLNSGTDRLEQNLKIAGMLSQVTAENAPAMLEAFQNSPRSWLTDHHYRMFLYAWGKVDGEAAVEYGFKNQEGREVSFRGESAMSAWASVDPDAAWEYMQNEEPGMARRMHGSYVYGLASNRPQAATDYLGKMEPGRQRDESVDTVVRSISDSGPRGLLDWSTQVLNHDDQIFAKRVIERATIASARDDGIQLARWLDTHSNSEHVNARMFEEAADEWAESNPRAAANWLESHLDDERVNSKVIAELGEEWAKTDPQAAVAWVEGLEDERVNSQVITDIAREWADKDPERAIDWMGEYIEDLDANGIAGPVGQWAEKDPEAALDWVADLPENKRGASINAIARQWPENQLEDAVAWLDKSEGNQYDGARESLTWRLMGDDGAAALRLASTITDKAKRDRLVVRSAWSLNRQNPDAIEAWLPVSGLSDEQKKQVLSSEGRGWDRWRGRGRGR